MSERSGSKGLSNEGLAAKAKQVGLGMVVLLAAGCAKVIQGEAVPHLEQPMDDVSIEHSTEVSVPPTTASASAPTTSSKPPKACKWSVANPQPFETSNPQPTVTLTRECTVAPTDPIKLYGQASETSKVVVAFDPKGELAVEAECVTEGDQVVGVNGPSSVWTKVFVVAKGDVYPGYLSGPNVGYVAGPTDKVAQC